MNQQRLSRAIKGFHLDSFHAGVNSAFAEAVGFGCKSLALSEPYTDEELDALIEPTKTMAESYDLLTYVDDNFLTTKLFDPSFTRDKTVILIAHSREVIDEYLALKALREDAILGERLEDVEDDIAWRFGRLLSYSDEAITRLLNRQAMPLAIS